MLYILTLEHKTKDMGNLEKVFQWPIKMLMLNKVKMVGFQVLHSSDTHQTICNSLATNKKEKLNG